MADAELEKTTIPIHISSLPQIFTATGEVIQFDGFLKVYMESQDDEKEDEKNDLLPPLHKGDRLERTKIEAIEQYTMHPPRYTEASLVKKMENSGNRTSFHLCPDYYDYPKPGIISLKRAGKVSNVKFKTSN